MDYRPDIDGLRAVAVTSVLLGHVGVAGFSGGFVGVDVFFVISGYLIGGLIFEETAAGTFSFVRFYERRVRRIAPALLATIAATLAAGWAFMWPADFSVLADAALWSVAMLPNFYFEDHMGYFDRAAETLPLLHLWSLGVEEQFYVGFPIFAWLTARLSRRLFSAIAGVIFFVSLLWAQQTIQTAPGAAFYLPQFRAWELLLGVFLALGQTRLASVSDRFAGIAGAIGLVMIVAAVARFSPNTPFPGFNALLPCVGAALVIIGRGPASAALSFAPVVYVGRISYSLYLAHWPLIVFSKVILSDWSPAARATVVITSAFGLAALSYHFIEQPIRRRLVLPTRRSVFVGTAAVACSLAIAGAAIVVLKGVPERIPVAARQVAAFIDYPEFKALYRERTCFLDIDQDASSYDPVACLPHQARSVILWGDSLAAHYYAALRSMLAPDGVEVGLATYAGCPPLLGFAEAVRPHCLPFNEKVVDLLTADPPAVIVLAASWPEVPVAERQRFVATLDSISAIGSRVIVVGMTPAYLVPVPTLAARKIASGQEVIGVARDMYPGARDSDGWLSSVVAGRGGVEFVPVFDFLCPEGRCALLAAPQIPLQWDATHFTKEGAMIAAAPIAKEVRKAFESR